MDADSRLPPFRVGVNSPSDLRSCGLPSGWGEIKRDGERSGDPLKSQQVEQAACSAAGVDEEASDHVPLNPHETPCVH